MSIKDFNVSDDLKRYTTKERFWFENDVISFWYRFIISCYEYTDWFANYSTRYSLYMFPDDESIHESYRNDKSHFNTMKSFLDHYAYVLRVKEVKGRINEKELEKIANCIDKINIESKIKVNKYQKIKELVNGTTFYV